MWESRTSAGSSSCWPCVAGHQPQAKQRRHQIAECPSRRSTNLHLVVLLPRRDFWKAALGLDRHASGRLETTGFADRPAAIPDAESRTGSADVASSSPASTGPSAPI